MHNMLPQHMPGTLQVQSGLLQCLVRARNWNHEYNQGKSLVLDWCRPQTLLKQSLKSAHLSQPLLPGLLVDAERGAVHDGLQVVHGGHAVRQLHDVGAARLLTHVGGKFEGKGSKELLNTGGGVERVWEGEGGEWMCEGRGEGDECVYVCRVCVCVKGRGECM